MKKDSSESFFGVKMIKLVTSNARKIAEIKAAGFPYEIVDGDDIPEIQHDDPNIVAAYKAIDAGPIKLVEDTVLFINGKAIVDIKFKEEEMTDYIGFDAVWRVTFAYSDERYVYLFIGETEGQMVEPNERSPKSFGFNPYFKPKHHSKTLAEMLGNYGSFNDATQYIKISARVKALHRFIKKEPTMTISTFDLPEWEGEYQ